MDGQSKRRSRNHISHVCTFVLAPFRRSCLWLLARCRRTPGLPKAGVILLTCQQMYHRELDHQAPILNPIIQTILATSILILAFRTPGHESLPLRVSNHLSQLGHACAGTDGDGPGWNCAPHAHVTTTFERNGYLCLGTYGQLSYHRCSASAHPKPYRHHAEHGFGKARRSVRYLPRPECFQTYNHLARITTGLDQYLSSANC